MSARDQVFGIQSVTIIVVERTVKYPALLANRMRGPGNNGFRMGLWSRSHKLVYR